MVGTVFLWMFWPSFNGALAGPSQQQRVIVNTVLAISASCVTACGTSRLFLHKLDMEVVLNATLAGGVAIGSASDLVVNALFTTLIGSAAGILSALGFLYLSSFLQEKINLHDTCGVHNLHGMPGVMGGLVGALSASLSGNAYSEAAQIETFAAMGDGRTAQQQGMYQVAALGITLGIAIISGILSGFLVSNCCVVENFFDDEEHFRDVEFDVPLEEDENIRKSRKGHDGDDIHELD